jgi:hypothetical protein
MSSNLYAQALVSNFYGLIEFWEGDNVQVTSASTSQSKHFLVTNFSCLVNRPAKFLVKMPVQSSAALAALHDSPVALGAHAVYAWHQSRVSTEFRLYRPQDVRFLPQSFVARMHDRLGRMRMHPRIGS